jgi:tetratricopeptide (TPR) repeat protein
MGNTRWSRLAAILVGAYLAACHSAGSHPPLPEISTGGFLPAIRQEVDAAISAAKTRPDDAAAAGRLGMVLQAHKQLQGARQCYRRAASLDPRSFEWRYYLGTVSEGQEAADSLRAALRLRDYLPAKLRLGETLQGLGDFNGARDVYRGLQHPAALFGYGRATNDPTYYEKALAGFPQYGAALFALAQHCQRAGRGADAQRLLTDYARYKLVAPRVEDPLLDAVEALNRGPDRLLTQAADLEAQGQLAAAAELQLKALELDPRLAQAHINLISLYGRLGKAAEAEAQYREAIALAPNAFEAYYNFGVFCYAANRHAEARAAFSRALAINPNSADAHNNMGALLQEDGKVEDAAEEFRKAIQLQPGLRLAHFHLGRIYANQRRWSSAIEQLRQAADGDDEATPTYLYALGATQARAGDSSGAASMLAAAREKALARGQVELAASIARDLGKLKR